MRTVRNIAILSNIASRAKTPSFSERIARKNSHFLSSYLGRTSLVFRESEGARAAAPTVIHHNWHLHFQFLFGAAKAQWNPLANNTRIALEQLIQLSQPIIRQTLLASQSRLLQQQLFQHVHNLQLKNERVERSSHEVTLQQLSQLLQQRFSQTLEQGEQASFTYQLIQFVRQSGSHARQDIVQRLIGLVQQFDNRVTNRFGNPSSRISVQQAGDTLMQLLTNSRSNQSNQSFINNLANRTNRSTESFLTFVQGPQTTNRQRIEMAVGTPQARNTILREVQATWMPGQVRLSQDGRSVAQADQRQSVVEVSSMPQLVRPQLVYPSLASTVFQSVYQPLLTSSNRIVARSLVIDRIRSGNTPSLLFRENGAEAPQGRQLFGEGSRVASDTASATGAIVRNTLQKFVQTFIRNISSHTLQSFENAGPTSVFRSFPNHQSVDRLQQVLQRSLPSSLLVRESRSSERFRTLELPAKTTNQPSRVSVGASPVLQSFFNSVLRRQTYTSFQPTPNLSSNTISNSISNSNSISIVQPVLQRTPQQLAARMPLSEQLRQSVHNLMLHRESRVEAPTERMPSPGAVRSSVQTPILASSLVQSILSIREQAGRTVPSSFLQTILQSSRDSVTQQIQQIQPTQQIQSLREIVSPSSFSTMNVLQRRETSLLPERDHVRSLLLFRERVESQVEPRSHQSEGNRPQVPASTGVQAVFQNVLQSMLRPLYQSFATSNSSLFPTTHAEAPMTSLVRQLNAYFTPVSLMMETDEGARPNESVFRGGNSIVQLRSMLSQTRHSIFQRKTNIENRLTNQLHFLYRNSQDNRVSQHLFAPNHELYRTSIQMLQSYLSTNRLLYNLFTKHHQLNQNSQHNPTNRLSHNYLNNQNYQYNQTNPIYKTNQSYQTNQSYNTNQNYRTNQYNQTNPIYKTDQNVLNIRNIQFVLNNPNLLHNMIVQSSNPNIFNDHSTPNTNNHLANVIHLKFKSDISQTSQRFERFQPIINRIRNAFATTLNRKFTNHASFNNQTSLQSKPAYVFRQLNVTQATNNMHTNSNVNVNATRSTTNTMQLQLGNVIQLHRTQAQRNPSTILQQITSRHTTQLSNLNLKNVANQPLVQSINARSIRHGAVTNLHTIQRAAAGFQTLNLHRSQHNQTWNSTRHTNQLNQLVKNRVAYLTLAAQPPQTAPAMQPSLQAVPPIQRATPPRAAEPPNLVLHPDRGRQQQERAQPPNTQTPTPARLEYRLEKQRKPEPAVHDTTTQTLQTIRREIDANRNELQSQLRSISVDRIADKVIKEIESRVRFGQQRRGL
ncbi:hypothetical protein [Paenibacillus koleovorans]|uniref:hypothetical protein n=1 Tax=Paenibacillus koleovorans TaxID=121608 RepID=UPI000FDBD5A6|nr:hypothetical protein [Paenibacillus koleovorans]